ncbi:unnamed protein product, partial [marine sediment metagenome]
MIENSEVMRNVLTTLLKISNRKATGGDVAPTMGSLIKKLEEKYSFLEHVEIKDTRFLEAVDPITVMSDVNSVPPAEIGKAIHEIIYSMNESLGRDAGFYFIKEIGNRIGDDCYTTIRDDMGVNLNLMQMERDVSRME